MSRNGTLEKNRIEGLGGVGPKISSPESPYTVEIELTGTKPIIFHRWSCEEVERKAEAKKGSKEKKTDDPNVSVYRDADGFICLPGRYVTSAICDTAKRFPDKSSPRKSARDMFKAGIDPLTELAPILIGGKKVKDWQFLDKRRMKVQQAAITRVRPAFLEGWKAELQIQVLLPEFIDERLLLEVLEMCGRINGLADSRPTYGKFQVTRFERVELK